MQPFFSLLSLPCTYVQSNNYSPPRVLASLELGSTIHLLKLVQSPFLIYEGNKVYLYVRSTLCDSLQRSCYINNFYTLY